MSDDQDFLYLSAVRGFNFILESLVDSELLMARLSLIVLIHRFWLSRRGCEVLHISVDWKRTNDRKKHSLTHRHWSSFFFIFLPVESCGVCPFFFYSVSNFSSSFIPLLFSYLHILTWYIFLHTWYMMILYSFFSISWCRRCAYRYFFLSLLQYNHIVLFDLAWLCLVRPLFKFIFCSRFVLENFTL